MRIISKRTLMNFWNLYPDCEQSLKAWYHEVSSANWSKHAELKNHFASASVINKKRVVFNIQGNNYRIIVDIEYKLKIIFIVWIGTHKQYDNINISEVKYVKTNKK